MTFASRRNGNWDLWTKPVDGTGEATELVATSGAEGDADWSTDGKYMLFGRIDPVTNRDIWYLRQDPGGHKEAVQLVRTQFDEKAPKFSPNGRYVAYVSNESGSDQVYIRPFSGDGRLRVSLDGGAQPRWRRDGKELIFVSGDTLMAASVTLRPELTIGAPEELFKAEGLAGSFAPRYDVVADGRRFVLTEPVQQGNRCSHSPSPELVRRISRSIEMTEDPRLLGPSAGAKGPGRRALPGGEDPTAFAI